MDEITVAGDAFRFLMDKHLQDVLPDDPASQYARAIVAQRLGPSAAAKSGTGSKPPVAVAPAAAIAPPPPTNRKDTGDPLAEARAYVEDCVRTGKSVNRATVAAMTGMSAGAVSRFIQTFFEPKPRKPGARKPMSEETKQKMRAAQQARFAEKRGAGAAADHDPTAAPADDR